MFVPEGAERLPGESPRLFVSLPGDRWFDRDIEDLFRESVRRVHDKELTVVYYPD